MKEKLDLSLYEKAEITLNKKQSLGSKVFSEREIIEFASVNDPLSFHLETKAAKQSIFKGLVCSGGQAFNFFYVNRWIPHFGKSVAGGLGINNWEFIRPIYVGEEVHGTATAVSIRESKSLPGLMIVKWEFYFEDNSGNLLQSMEIKILHKS